MALLLSAHPLAPKTKTHLRNWLFLSKLIGVADEVIIWQHKKIGASEESVSHLFCHFPVTWRLWQRLGNVGGPSISNAK
ncbi:hypothetical protein V6N13_133180 [Hibiscus sabdariffa]